MPSGAPPIFEIVLVTAPVFWCLGFLCTTFVILTDLLSKKPCPGRTGRTPLGGVVIALFWPFYAAYHGVKVLIPWLRVARCRIGKAWQRVKSNDWDI